MTTPERFRRRQRIEGTFLVIIGLLLVVSTLWFRHQDEQQRACLSRNFSELSEALTSRASFAEAESRAIRAESRANRRFYRDAFSAKTEADVFDAYGDYRVRIERIDQRRDRLKQEREANPIPEFPRGSV